jgi:hypothetical protein
MIPAGNPRLQVPPHVNVALAAGDPVQVIFVAVTPGPNRFATIWAGVAGESVSCANELVAMKADAKNVNKSLFMDEWNLSN